MFFPAGDTSGTGSEVTGMDVGGALDVRSGGTGGDVGDTRIAAAFMVDAWSVISSAGSGIEESSR